MSSAQKEPARTLGGVPKKKFIPKVPPKTQASSTTVEVASASDRKKESNSRRETSRRTESHPQHRSNQTHKERAGRGKFAMPTGVAFFTGSSSSTAAGSRQNIHIGENRREGSGAQVKKETHAASSKQSYLDENVPGAGPSESVPAAIEPEEVEEEEDPQYSSIDPVSLPLGPVTLEKRLRASQRRIFAAANDQAAIQAEEEEDIFLMQFPSSIKRCLEGTTTPSGALAATLNGAEAPRTGKIGKIQITKSGRVFLLLDDATAAAPFSNGDEGGTPPFPQTGRRRGLSGDGFAAMELDGGATSPSTPERYEINHGILSSFMQLATCVSTTHTEDSSGGVVHSSLEVLGPVTKKVIVTPDFDIGVRHSNAAAVGGVSSSRVAGEGLSRVRVKVEE